MTGSVNTRVGAIEALAAIRDTRAVDPLVFLLASEENSEARWAAALALGEIGDKKKYLKPHTSSP